MDGDGSSSGGNQGDGGDAGMPWAGVGGDAPLPPVFGNANAQAGGGDMDFKVGRAARFLIRNTNIYCIDRLAIAINLVGKETVPVAGCSRAR